MLYREAGQFKTTYEADQAIFPLRQDRIGIAVIAALAFVVVPLTATDFFLTSIMTPFLIFALAAIGLNVLTGYAGQLSLGTGAFMGVGAYSAYKLTSIFPDANIIVVLLASGFFSAAIGVAFGLPSLRIKGLYLAVTTLAAQFFLEWCFIRIPWLYNYNASGAIEISQREMAGIVVTGPAAAPLTQYFIVLCVTVGLTWFVSNLIRGRIGRQWMMIRDMDIAAELIGVRPLTAKLSAFAVSSYLCGVAGAMMVFFWLGAAEPSAFAISLSFQVLFMTILGGLGSLIGSYMGAAFIWILPVALRVVLPSLGFDVAAETVQHLTSMIVGALIIFFLITEPHGLARLWQLTKEKLKVWPFPYG
ncbi:amino acid/amide ABC transporter membrane protein 2 (HAAT family) [Breoghania corrubedonensis]|uniref:Amino acid/amide ABC transporter membrane protein 2 (HAAT family) n=1 Tax=Breoghania corrubedonensis TaxID=665038 RepID=A0A2T5V6R8_9HYPH|nr:branched-chain amino acid ABC transporter permease [Breoghania corrubedonensis]PTW59448.1 amino acid/amide ABC transporter membrane protein 2 (HAAT family) [Breoghania corrubedonensis]